MKIAFPLQSERYGTTLWPVSNGRRFLRITTVACTGKMDKLYGRSGPHSFASFQINKMKKSLFILLLFYSTQVSAQEFDKHSRALNLEFIQGFTKPKTLPELYLADLRLSYQYTIVPRLIRLGLTGGARYNNQHLSAIAGPELALKLTDFKTNLGTLANLQLLLEHLWGTEHQKLLGGGLRLAIGNTLLLSARTHRDYALKYWSLGFGIGLNFIKEKVPSIKLD